MENVSIGEWNACGECGQLLEAGELVWCGSEQRPECGNGCPDGFGCVTLCDACYELKAYGPQLVDAAGRGETPTGALPAR